jgi:hypothetical protein
MDTSDIIPAAAAEFLTGRRRKKSNPSRETDGKKYKNKIRRLWACVNLDDPVPGHAHISSFFFSHLLGGSLNIHLASEE